MRTLGLILIVLGIVMMLIRGFNVPLNKTVVNIGPVEINKKENKWVGWPAYAGSILAIVGAVIVIADRRRS